MAVPINHQLTFLTVVRTLKLYVRHPIQAARMERREWLKYAALRKMQRAGFAKYYDNDRFPVGAYAPDWADLWNIYSLVKARKPNRIMEFGAGCSTLMIAQAVHEIERETGHRPEFRSYDESEYWVGKLRNYFPPHLLPYCSLEHRQTEVIEVGGRPTITFRDLPKDFRPNFVYVDGPLGRPEAPFISVALAMEDNAPDDYFILVDGLGKTFQFMRQHLKYRYRFTENPIHYYRTCERVG